MIDRLMVAGTESQLVALIRSLDRARVRPFLCLLNGEDPASRSLEPPDCPVLRLGLKSFKELRALGAAVTLFRFLRRERIDVLQVYFPDSTYLGVTVGRLAGVSKIIRTRNNINHWMTGTHRVLGRLLNPLVTLTIANSEAGRQAVLRDEKPDPSSVVVIENGVDLERFTTAEAGGRPVGPRRVGMVANLSTVKGGDVFFRAAAQVAAGRPDVQFAIAGEGPQRAELERLAEDLEISDRVSLPGSLPAEAIPGFIGALTIAVLSSRAEGTPNAVLEYMAAGLPIVASNVGGIPVLIDNGVHGLLVPCEDPAPLAEAIARLLDDPDFAARLGRAARERAEHVYSRAAMVRKFEDFYLQLTGNSVDAR
jgi:glycosyltransferase involved in cell wall biosynthesis